MKVAVFGRPADGKGLKGLVELIETIVKAPSVEAAIYGPFYKYLMQHCPQLNVGNASFFSSHIDLRADTDLFLSLGGDGTLLSSVPLVREKKIPVAGINFGRLGFLTSSTTEGVKELLKGNFKTEKRPLLKMDYSGLPEDFYPFALNEFAVQRKGPAVLELEIKIGGSPIPRYMADGVIVSSATGSTAYSMSAGGPTVMPGCRVLTIVPIAPHNLNVRPLVVPDDSTIEVSFTTRYKDATLSADNRQLSLPDGACVRFSTGEACIELVSSDNDFIKALSQKLFWGADWRTLDK